MSGTSNTSLSERLHIVTNVGSGGFACILTRLALNVDYMEKDGPSSYYYSLGPLDNKVKKTAICIPD